MILLADWIQIGTHVFGVLTHCSRGYTEHITWNDKGVTGSQWITLYFFWNLCYQFYATGGICFFHGNKNNFIRPNEVILKKSRDILASWLSMPAISPLSVANNFINWKFLVNLLT